MKRQWVADNEVIINLQGLRWVAKEDTHYVTTAQEYRLKWNYKGSEHSHSYESKAARDSMFQMLQNVVERIDLGLG